MVYEMRKLQAQDIIPFTNLISKINVKEIAACFGKDRITKMVENASKKLENENTENTTDEKNENFVETLGYDAALEIVDVILRNLPNCEKPLFEFIASLTGQKADTIRTMELPDLIEQIKLFIQKDELQAFMKAAAKFIN